MSELIAAGKFVRLMRDGRWEYAERTNSRTSVMVFAKTPGNSSTWGKLLLVEQFRVPMGCSVIELPAGLCDEGEDPKTAALRELEEETGYHAASASLLFSTPVSAGLTNETVQVFHAEDLTKVSEGGGIDGEKLIIHEVPIVSLVEWLKQKEIEGCFVDSKIYAAMYFMIR